MGAAYPELGARARRDPALGHRRGAGLRPHAGDRAWRCSTSCSRRGEVSGEDAFKLHDTFGFPIDLTRRDRRRARGAGRHRRLRRAAWRSSACAPRRARARRSASGPSRRSSASCRSEPTAFTGYEHLEERTTVAGVLEQGGRTFVKLAESPFYAQGGGQVSDAGDDRVRGRRLPRDGRRGAARRRRPGGRAGGRARAR